MSKGASKKSRSVCWAFVALVVLATQGNSRDGLAADYRGTIIDAQGQLRCETNEVVIYTAIKKFDVAHTLLSAGGCNEVSKLSGLDLRVLKLVEELKGRASFLISPKKKFLKNLFRADQLHFDKAVGFAEIMVQHVPYKHPSVRTKGINRDLQSGRTKKEISLVLGRKVPVMLHLELNDFEDQSAKILEQLKDLLKRKPNGNFILMHMAQASVSEARDLIGNHENIYFLTSGADALLAASLEYNRRKGYIAQIGWINLFNDPPKGAPYNGWFRDYLPTLKWRAEWKTLIESYPDRFIFAMDNVLANHWKKRYRFTLALWRKAFSQLSEETARKVACANANHLWRLNVECKTR
ncbi:MAG: amidohydrolase family protein [Rhodospirillales bacterium]|jgi:hypothetical protein|nr:amidohydrolase family protein [Rhodospirillales bacterium]|tara:strand:- start:236 stop:1291 length:1056 start_codon:yes stop_codon:yes gene_type:complete